ncbi:hypothetical protein Tco_0939429 [Tanacetum coccineum]|uniref:Uncharacterized protein n=1 Tax=Tanacetum coccineum TaxID=301880 RepID=A0ABQ5DRW9_9ASTR
MSQPANDKFSQHLSDEESNHKDASDTGATPKQPQQMIPQTTAFSSNIKLPILKKMENSKKRISTGKDGIVRVLSPVTAVEIQAVEKERKAKNNLPEAISKNIRKDFMECDDCKKNYWKAIRTKIDDVDIEEMDINWQIAMIAIRMKKFYKKTGRRVRVDGKTPVEDSIGKPSYSTFTKTNDFKRVPHPLSGDYTPKPQEEIDDSLNVYGKKGPQKPEISVLDENSSEHSTCQSNDSEGSCENDLRDILFGLNQKVR